MRHDETRDNTTTIETQSIEADAHADTREGNTMRVSEITLGNDATRVETPTDADRVFAGPNGEAHRLKFIAEHGDVAVVWDQKFKVWRVPVFAEKRERFSNAKAKDIARWGSE